MSTPAIDIRPDHWQIVRHILRRHVPQCAVWAFGSRAKWTAKPHSDLDLAIITDQPLPLSVSAALDGDFSESNLPWKVDVVDWAATSESFRKIIERDKVVVHTPIEMGNWRETTLGEVCKLQGGSIQTGPFGSQLHASDYTSAGTPVVMPINLIAGSISEEGIARVSDEETARLARHKLAPGDIVFSRRGDVTRFALVSEREAGWLCGTGCLKVSVGNSTVATPGFIAAVLASPESKEWLIRHAVGATMPNLNTEILAGVPVTLLPLEEQRAIAGILGALDAKIELNRRMNQTLEAIAAALFKSWFVDYDGVPLEDMQESELGLIPNGWRVGTLGECCENIRKQARPDALPTGTPYIGLEHMPRKSIALAEWGVSDGLASGKFWYQRNDILFGKLRPYFHKVGVAAHEGVCSTDILVVRAKPHWFGFAVMHLFSDTMISYVTQFSNGAKMPRTNWTDIAGYKVALPPLKVTAEFDGAVRPLVEKVHANVEAAATLAQLRDALLPRLISGKLRLGEAGRIAEEAV
jgi:type I restriction enzyme S subunit